MAWSEKTSPTNYNIMKKSFLSYAIAGLGLIAFVSCSDSIESNLTDNEFLAAEEEAFISECEEGAGHYADFMLAEELRGEGCAAWVRKIPECATVTESGEGYPKTTIIEFGEDCKDKHGRSRSGKVVIVESDDMKNVGATRTVTFEHFGLENHSMKGVKTITNKGKNSNGNYVFERSSEVNGSGPKGDFTRTSTGEIEWLAGFDTDDCYDNVLSITGSSSTLKDGEEMGSRVISEPIIRNFDCKHPIAGVVEMDGKRGKATMDFGDGTCDSIATVTKDGEAKEIDLDKRRGKHGKKRGSRRK